MTNNFADFIAAERQRLDELKQSLCARRKELEQQLASIDIECAAIHAYTNTRDGHKDGQNHNTPNLSRSGITNRVYEAVKNGTTERRKLISTLGMTGQQVSNALTSLKKNGRIRGERGIYSIIF